MKIFKDSIIILGVIIIVCVLLDWKCGIDQRKDNIIAALNDTLKITRNDNGSLTGKIQSIEVTNADQFLTIQSDKAIIKELQAEVKRNKKYLANGGSVAVAHVETNINSQDSVTVTGRDTIRKDSVIYVYPEYESSITQFGDWIIGKQKMNRDSSSLQLKIKHDFSITVGHQSNGLFKPSTPYAEITSKNPYDTIVDFRTMNIAISKSKKAQNIGIGILIGIIGTLLIK